jgi:hypothetical protein
MDGCRGVYRGGPGPPLAGEKLEKMTFNFFNKHCHFAKIFRYREGLSAKKHKNDFILPLKPIFQRLFSTLKFWAPP